MPMMEIQWEHDRYGIYFLCDHSLIEKKNTDNNNEVL